MKVRRPEIIQSILRKIGKRRKEPSSQYMSREELTAVNTALEILTSKKKLDPKTIGKLVKANS